MSHIRMSHGTHTNESSHTYEWIMSHIWMFYLSRLKRREADEALLQVQLGARVCDVTHSSVQHDSYLTHSFVCHDSFGCVTWLILMCNMNHSYKWHDSLVRVTWLVHMCDMTRSYVWHDSFLCVTWPIRTSDMTHWYVWHDSFICATWLVHMCDMTRSYVRHTSVICVCIDLHVCRDSFICATWLIYMCNKIQSRLKSLMCVSLSHITFSWIRVIYFSHMCLYSNHIPQSYVFVYIYVCR